VGEGTTAEFADDLRSLCDASARRHAARSRVERLFDAWKNVDGRPGSPKIKDARIALNDDYLKFLRWAVWKVVEQPGGARHRIVAFVTNHGFVERHGRTLDTDQIQGFQSAIHAVRECIRLGPGLDAALNSVLVDPLDLGDAG